MSDKGRLLTYDEVTEWLHICKDVLRKLARKGEINAVKLGTARNSPVRISEASVQDYIRRNTVQSATGATNPGETQ